MGAYSPQRNRDRSSAIDHEPEQRDALQRREDLQAAADLPRERAEHNRGEPLWEVDWRQRVPAVVERRVALTRADAGRVELGLHRTERERRQAQRLGTLTHGEDREEADDDDADRLD